MDGIKAGYFVIIRSNTLLRTYDAREGTWKNGGLDERAREIQVLVYSSGCAGSGLCGW